MTAVPTSPRSQVSLLVGGALVLILVLASQLYVWINLWPMTVSWGEALLLAVPQLLVWGALIPLMGYLARRLPIEGEGAFARAVAHLVASVAVSILALGVIDVSDRMFHWTRALGAPGKLVADIRVTVVHLHLGIGLYWVVVAVSHALRYYDVSREREVLASRLEAQLAQAELQALRMQLNPHFLFNALNSISVLLRRDAKGAGVMLERLADLLKTTLRGAGQERVPLEAEIRYVRSYLAIEETRFRDRLTVAWDLDEEVLGREVPFLVLQPLVENAIRHGIAAKPGQGRIEVGAHERDGAIELRVADDGVGLPPGFSASAFGVGLSNIELRLERLYGERGALEVRAREGGGTEVLVRIPAVEPSGSGRAEPEDVGDLSPAGPRS